jgi:LAO/AO transport system kinase
MPNIIKTIASENKGIEEIANEINRHKDYLKTNKIFISKREQQTKNRIKNIVENNLKEKLWSESAENSLNLSLEKVVLGDFSPYQIAENIIDNFVNHKK